MMYTIFVAVMLELRRAIYITGGTQWCSLLRHFTTIWNVKVWSRWGHLDFSFGPRMALGPNWPLTEMSTRNISWGVKTAIAYGWQPYHIHVLIVWKYGSLKLLESLGPIHACEGTGLCQWACFCNQSIYMHIFVNDLRENIYSIIYRNWHQKFVTFW
jgi:hypothetical protein